MGASNNHKELNYFNKSGNGFFSKLPVQPTVWVVKYEAEEQAKFTRILTYRNIKIIHLGCYEVCGHLLQRQWKIHKNGHIQA